MCGEVDDRESARTRFPVDSWMSCCADEHRVVGAAERAPDAPYLPLDIRQRWELVGGRRRIPYKQERVGPRPAGGGEGRQESQRRRHRQAHVFNPVAGRLAIGDEAFEVHLVQRAVGNDDDPCAVGDRLGERPDQCRVEPAGRLIAGLQRVAQPVDRVLIGLDQRIDFGRWRQHKRFHPLRPDDPQKRAARRQPERHQNSPKVTGRAAERGRRGQRGADPGEAELLGQHPGPARFSDFQGLLPPASAHQEVHVIVVEAHRAGVETELPLVASQPAASFLDRRERAAELLVRLRPPSVLGQQGAQPALRLPKRLVFIERGSAGDHLPVGFLGGRGLFVARQDQRRTEPRPQAFLAHRHPRAERERFLVVLLRGGQIPGTDQCQSQAVQPLQGGVMYVQPARDLQRQPVMGDRGREFRPLMVDLAEVSQPDLAAVQVAHLAGQGGGLG